jgi:hypothetical protein
VVHRSPNSLRCAGASGGWYAGAVVRVRGTTVALATAVLLAGACGGETISGDGTERANGTGGRGDPGLDGALILSATGGGGDAAESGGATVAGSEAGSCRTYTACQDADGDGHRLCEPGQEAGVPEECIDCDDTDPELQTLGYLDADGDGYVVGQTGECLPDPLPPGYVLPGAFSYYADCDDSDPNVHLTGYWDGDGDGHTAPDAAAGCLAGGESQPGYTAANRGEDCDDEDPLVSPSVPEQWNDAIDSNCDGLVDPAGCAGGDDTADDCTCYNQPVNEDPVPPGGCTGQPDLYLDHVYNCVVECHGTVGAILVVGNRGDIAYRGSGAVVRRFRDGEVVWEQSVVLSVDPGEQQYVGAPFWHEGAYVAGSFGYDMVVQLQAPDDCDGGTASVTVGQVLIYCHN